MNSDSTSYRLIVTIYIAIGAAIGILLLHPMAMIVAWGELREASITSLSLWAFMLNRVETVFSTRVLPMTFTYAFVGGTIGFVFALNHLALAKKSRTVKSLFNSLAVDLPALIRGGENENVEFKSSVRWDFQHNTINRALEMVIAKTIAGFMNHGGGSLIIGVTDAGEVVGLKNDYQTLKHKNSDGLERCITDIVNKKLGGDKCTLVHCMFHEIEEIEICRVVVDPAPIPVYLNDGKLSRYFVRTGNSTRELNTREALEHISQRK